MPSFICRRLLSIKTLCLMLLIFTITGCGSVEWFPEYERLPITPDQFSIPNESDVDLATSVTSDAITVSGLTGDSSPITITGPALNSKYSINGATATDVAGTVKNGDQVKVTHTSSTNPGVLAVSTLTIGDRKSEFISTTKIVAPPVFSAPIQSAGFLQVEATVNASDIRPHTVSINERFLSLVSKPSHRSWIESICLEVVFWTVI